MRIELYLLDKVMSFSLPKEISGSFSFDENPEEESKLINIEARDGEWFLYSTHDVKVMDNNIFLNDIKLEKNQFYIIRRFDKNYLIYTSDIFDDTIVTYTYNQSLNLIVGTTGQCNVTYQFGYFNDLMIKLNCVNNQIVLENNSNRVIYINDRAVGYKKCYIHNGDKLNIYGLKILFLPNLLLINNPKNRLFINEQQAGLQSYYINPGEEPQSIEFKDEELYDKDEYFSKAPRIRRIIETKKIELSQPPKPEGTQELPLILTIGPMLTMGIMSAITLFNVISQVYTGEKSIGECWTQLFSSAAMLLSMLLWPLLTKWYNKRLKKQKRQEIIKKYNEYLDKKKTELTNETKLQKEILVENLITIEDCINIIRNKTINFWDKRIDQNDVLIVRIGTGNELLNVEIQWPEEGFTIEEDDLKAQADKMIEDFKYIENVPIGYSLYDNKTTAIMGSNIKSINFVNNIILQLITFYSYEDLKLVVFTNEQNESNWDYIKYLNHNFSNDKQIRLFASNQESSKTLAEYLEYILSTKQPVEKPEDITKPYYVIITDDYKQIKRYNFIKTLTESNDNLGFSLLILENRLSNLPSKCNNFISLGEKTSGILKNSYEQQEQVVFYDEINYTVNMMDIAKRVSNIPIEFEEGLQQLPESITFLEMEKVGKVKQLNILNRWNTNDSTKSLKAEVGVGEDGDLMYLDLHEKFHGPHGLVAGMTGSGKSEFIITYILSMAINYSPDDVAFILIDYKGGGLAFAFENQVTGVKLPHLAGTITNLDKAEMDRTLVSIDSEVKRRQSKFNEVRDQLGESTIDIYKYQRFYKEGKIKEPIPHLFIVCDEFAELKSQQPDFMDNLISIARIGRSLGVHLILATQKPSGVVNDQIWSNSKFHVCLKVQDASDSNEMLKKPDAANLKQTGRFYLQVGYDEYFALGQSAWCGAKYYPSDQIIKQVDKSINFINDIGMIYKSIQAGNGKQVKEEGEQLAAIMKEIIDVAKSQNKEARRLWLDNIPQIILVDKLIEKYNIKFENNNIKAIIGEYDAPELQKQGILEYNILEQGNTAIYGSDGSESEQILNSIIYSTIMNYSSSDINYYILDFGSQALRKFSKAPHVGDIVFLGEDEKYKNFFKMIKDDIDERKKLFADYGGDFANYQKNSGKKIPLKIVIMNNYDSINENDKTLFETFPEIIRDSERYGIVFIITAIGVSTIPRRVSQNITNIYALKLKDHNDYISIFSAKKKLVPRDIEGRGIYQDGDILHEFQTASIIENEDELNKFVLEKVEKLKDTNKETAEKIPVLPEQVTMDYVEAKIKGINNIPIGINKNDLSVVRYNFTNTVGTAIIANKLNYTKSFMKSFIDIIKRIENATLVVFDPLKLLVDKKDIVKNYYDSDFPTVLDKIIDYIQKLTEEKKDVNLMIIIYGINKFAEKLEDKKKIKELFDVSKKYEKVSIVISDDMTKVKAFGFDDWYKENFSGNDGIYIGKGVGEQTVMKISNFNSELTKEYENNIAFCIKEGSYRIVKAIEFEKISEEEEDD